MSERPEDVTGPVTQNFASVFSEAIARQGLTLDRLQARLRAAGVPVSAATLSYWQTGRSIPTRVRSMRAVAELEHVLGLEPGHLAGALPSDTMRWDPHIVMPAHDQVMALVDEMSLDLRRRFTGVTNVDEIVVGPDRVERLMTTSQLLRCESDGFHRFPVIFQQDAEGPAAPEVEGLMGCRVGETRSLPEVRVTVAEVLLPRTLSRGELLHLSMRVHWAPTTTPTHRAERSLPNRHAHHVTTVLFEGSPPRRATRYQLSTVDESTDLPGNEDELPGVDVPIADGQVQSVVRDAALGIHGIAWQW